MENVTTKTETEEFESFSTNNFKVFDVGVKSRDGIKPISNG